MNHKVKQWMRENNWLAIEKELTPYCEENKPGWYDTAALSSLGFAYTQLNRLEDARRMYNRWMELEPDRARAFYSMGYVDYLEERWEHAIEWFQKALNLFPEYLVCLYRLGYSFWAWNKPKQARKSLEQVRHIYQTKINEDQQLRHLKTYVKSSFVLGKVLLKFNQPEAAKTIFKETLELNQNRYLADTFFYYELGKTEVACSNYQTAIDHFYRSHSPYHPKEYVLDQIGRVLALQKQHRRAIVEFNQALKIRRKPYILMNRAKSYWALDNTQEAIRDLYEALKRDRKAKHKIRLLLAQIYFSLNKLEDMKGELLRAIQFKLKTYGTDYAEAHLLLAQYYSEKGNQQKSDEEFKIALQINPDLQWGRINEQGMIKNDQIKEKVKAEIY